MTIGGTSACFDPDRSDDEIAAGTSGAEGTTDAADPPEPPDGGSSAGDPIDGDSSDAPSDQAEACATYCTLMDDYCTGELQQYTGELSCQSVCEDMNLGTPQDALGNTVGCRTHHALLAAEAPDPHCAHAGPTGEGTCGANCESFCGLALVTCDGLSVWNDADECIADCETWPQEPKYQANVPDDDTYACQMRHLTLAALQPEVHCQHLGPDSPVCAAP